MIKMYNEVCKGWLIRAIKRPMISIINDHNVNFDFMDYSLGSLQIENNFMKLKVRIKGIFNSILENMDLKIIPVPFIIFLGNLISHKSFMPDNFLTQFEINRLQLDAYGALYHPDED